VCLIIMSTCRFCGIASQTARRTAPSSMEKTRELPPALRIWRKFSCGVCRDNAHCPCRRSRREASWLSLLIHLTDSRATALLTSGSRAEGSSAARIRLQGDCLRAASSAPFDHRALHAIALAAPSGGPKRFFVWCADLARRLSRWPWIGGGRRCAPRRAPARFHDALSDLSWRVAFGQRGRACSRSLTLALARLVSGFHLLDTAYRRCCGRWSPRPTCGRARTSSVRCEQVLQTPRPAAERRWRCADCKGRADVQAVCWLIAFFGFIERGASRPVGGRSFGIDSDTEIGIDPLPSWAEWRSACLALGQAGGERAVS